MKRSSHSPVDPIEKQHYKKKFLTRKLQEEDAEQQIRQYASERDAPSTPLPEARDVEAKREL